MIAHILEAAFLLVVLAVVRRAWLDAKEADRLEALRGRPRRR